MFYVLKAATKLKGRSKQTHFISKFLCQQLNGRVLRVALPNVVCPQKRGPQHEITMLVNATGLRVVESGV